MESLDWQILELLGRYRVAVRAVLGMLSETGEVPDASLSRLARDGFIARCRAFPGQRTVYQLTKKGAAKVGVSEARARSFQAQALFKHLGILLFCHVLGSRRFRLEDNELQRLLGEEMPDGAHCMSVKDGKPIVLNVYVPGPNTSLRSIERHIREQLFAARKLSAVRDLLAQRTYGFAVITETPERRKAILAVLRQPERGGAPPLAKQVRIAVESLPEFDRLINGSVGRGPDKSVGEPLSELDSGPEQQVHEKTCGELDPFEQAPLASVADQYSEESAR